MNRWHRELPLMETRLRFEKDIHSWGSSGRPYEECHCYEKRGLFRKDRPLSHRKSPRYFRLIPQYEARRKVKAMRRLPVEIEED